MECFVFGNKEGQEVIDTTSCHGRKNHENHIKVYCVGIDLENHLENIEDWDKTKGYEAITC